MAMRWTLAGFIAVRKKAASHISDSCHSFCYCKTPFSLPLARPASSARGGESWADNPAAPSQHCCSVKAGHRDLDWDGVLFVTMWITTLSFAHMQAHPIWTPRSTEPTSKEILKGPWKFEVLYLTTAKVICLHGNWVTMKCTTFAG